MAQTPPKMVPPAPLRGKHARRAAFAAKSQAMPVKVGPMPMSPRPPVMPAQIPSPSAPSALMSRTIKFPAQPVGGGSLSSLLMG